MTSVHRGTAAAHRVPPASRGQGDTEAGHDEVLDQMRSWISWRLSPGTYRRLETNLECPAGATTTTGCGWRGLRGCASDGRLEPVYNIGQESLRPGRKRGQCLLDRGQAQRTAGVVPGGGRQVHARPLPVRPPGRRPGRVPPAAPRAHRRTGPRPAWPSRLPGRRCAVRWRGGATLIVPTALIEDGSRYRVGRVDRGHEA